LEKPGKATGVVLELWCGFRKHFGCRELSQVETSVLKGAAPLARAGCEKVSDTHPSAELQRVYSCVCLACIAVVALARLLVLSLSSIRAGVLFALSFADRRPHSIIISLCGGPPSPYEAGLLADNGWATQVGSLEPGLARLGLHLERAVLLWRDEGVSSEIVYVCLPPPLAG